MYNFIPRKSPTVLAVRDNTEYRTCCFCEDVFQGYGNNPDTESDNDRCCNECNDSIVIPHRISLMFGGN